MDSIYNIDDRDSLILQLAEILKDLTNWGKFDLPEEWDKKIVAFDRVVKQIPTKYLEHCVMYAAQNHKKEKDFAPFQVVEAWNDVSETLARDEAGGSSRPTRKPQVSLLQRHRIHLPRKNKHR